jgi:hypothetical protein
MATFTRVNGYAAPAEQIGRDIKFVNVAWTGIHTSYDAPGSNHELATQAVAQYCTVTIVGIPASDNAKFMVEGLPTHVGGSDGVVGSVGTGTAIATKLKADIEAAIGGTATVTVNSSLSGTTFA